MDKNRHVKKLISILSLDCTTKLKNDKERNFYRGHEYVDLGLPSGTLWATMNVGAESEFDCGNYYMYGMGSETYNSSDSTYLGTEDTLDPSADTATQVWGGMWHTPTREQMQELNKETEYQWVTDYKGSCINGGLFTSKINGKSVFFPACGSWYNGSHINVGSRGYYWSSSPNGSDYAYGLYVYCGSFGVGYYCRYYGDAVRPVLKLE